MSSVTQRATDSDRNLLKSREKRCPSPKYLYSEKHDFSVNISLLGVSLF
jgi:hypothetical protein